jgi:hypothetical protein
MIKEPFKLVNSSTGEVVESAISYDLPSNDNEYFVPTKVTKPNKAGKGLTEGAEKWVTRGEKFIVDSNQVAASQMMWGNEDNMSDIAAYDSWIQDYKQRYRNKYAPPDPSKSFGSKESRLALQQRNEKLTSPVKSKPVSGKVKKKGR